MNLIIVLLFIIIIIFIFNSFKKTENFEVYKYINSLPITNIS